MRDGHACEVLLFIDGTEEDLFARESESFRLCEFR